MVDNHAHIIKLSLSERNNYLAKINKINSVLKINGFKEVGDLFDLSFCNIMSTLNLINSLIEERQNSFDLKKELSFKITRIESEYQINIDKINNLNNKIADLLNTIDVLKNKLNLNEKKYSVEFDKYTKEKETLNIMCNKSLMKEKQYKHEIKKLESINDDLKIKLKKFMNDNKEIRIVDNKNEKIMINGEFIVFDNFLKNSPDNILNHSSQSRDFYDVIYRSYNEKIKSLILENQELKDCIKFLRNIIEEYNELKKSILFQFSKESLYNFENSNCFSNDIFNLDINVSKSEIMNNFNTLINIFRYMLIYDIYKVDPCLEMDFDSFRKQIKNQKFNLEHIPYFQKIQNIIQNLHLERLNQIKNVIHQTNEAKEKIKNQSIEKINDGELPFMKQDFIPEKMEQLEQEINYNISGIEENFKFLEDELIEEIQKYKI